MELNNPEKVLSKIFHKSVINTIKPGILTISAYANFYPVCYQKNGKLMGLDVEIMKQFAKLCKLKTKFIIKKKFKDIWLDPVTGKSDVSIGGIGITKGRTKVFTEWTIPYFYVNRTVIYNKNDPINRFPNDVSGTVVGTVGSTGWLDAKERLAKAHKTKFIKPGKTDDKDIQMLLDGDIQGMMRGSFVGKSIIKKYPQLGMVKPWEIEPDIVVKDGEVFAYPCNVRSRLGILLSVFLTEDIMNLNLKKLVEKYDLV